MGRFVTDPWLVVADANGDLMEVPGLFALGRSGGIAVRADPRSYIPLPEGSLLFHLPGRRPVGWNPETGQPVVLRELDGKEVFAAAAFLPPAHTLLCSPVWC